MHQYLAIQESVLKHGHVKGDRTGTGTISHFGQQQRFPLHAEFVPTLPTITTKKIHLPSVEHELIWMLSGDTRLEYLIENGVRIWNEWVIPGTKVYRDLTVEELKAELTKVIGGKYHVNFHADKSRQNIELIHVSDFKETLDYDPPIVEDGVTIIVSVNTFAYGALREQVAHLDSSHQYLCILYRMLVGLPRKLIGGDLGQVYGKTWRDIDDTRLISKVEWLTYEARGFKFVIDVPGADYRDDKCVVTRKVDQVKDLLDMLGREPTPGDEGRNRDSRRLIICAWDPCLIEDQALPPCHAFVQFFTRKLTLEERVKLLRIKEDTQEKRLLEEGIVTRGPSPVKDAEHFRALVQLWKKTPVTDEFLMERLDNEGIPTRAISCSLYQRSADVFLGVPFNITFYSLMTHMLANQFNMVAEEFVWTGGDTHIYSNHMDQVKLQQTRDVYEQPTIIFKPESKGKHILEITRDDYTIDNYKFHPHIAGKVAV